MKERTMNAADEGANEGSNLPAWWKSDKPYIIGDCLSKDTFSMKDIPDKSIDMILCDLPYGTTACNWDVIIPFEPLWEQYKRIIKDNGAIALMASQPFTSMLVTSNIKMFRYEWIWSKNMGGNFLMADKQPMKQHESILIFSKKSTNYYPIREDRLKSGLERVRSSNIKGGGSGVESVYGERGRVEKKYDDKRYPQSVQKFDVERGLHPTQKPVALFEYFIRTYTKNHDVILDNCLGSGTTLEACRNTGRVGLGFEINPEYETIIRKRSLQDIPRLETFEVR